MFLTQQQLLAVDQILQNSGLLPLEALKKRNILRQESARDSFSRRQSGKTTTIAAICLALAADGDNSKILVSSENAIRNLEQILVGLANKNNIDTETLALILVDTGDDFHNEITTSLGIQVYSTGSRFLWTLTDMDKQDIQEMQVVAKENMERYVDMKSVTVRYIDAKAEVEVAKLRAKTEIAKQKASLREARVDAAMKYLPTLFVAALVVGILWLMFSMQG